MSFLRLMLRAGARHRWRSWLALTLLTALVAGVAPTGAATARRTATAFPRFEAAHGYDAFFYSANPVPRAASLPEVASVTRIVAPAGGAPTCACRPISGKRLLPRRGPPGTADPGGQAAERSPARPVRPRAGPGIGEPPTTRRAHRQRPAHPAGALVPAGGGAEQRQPHPGRFAVTLHVVGLSVSEFAFPSTSGSPAYDVYGTSSFALKCDAQTVVFNDYLFRLRHGAAGLPRFETQVRTLGGLSGTDLDGKSLGFIRRQIALSVSWQTRTIAVIGIVLGVPLGVAAGRPGTPLRPIWGWWRNPS